jgi:rare lipoprotein A
LICVPNNKPKRECESMKFSSLPPCAAVLACALMATSQAHASPENGLRASPALKAQRGEASWYGPGFHGRRTASGETFNTNAMTAAHRTLPFGSRVRVVNERTGQSVVVRINDRGPFHKRRIIDLAKAPAKALGIAGVARVSVHAEN